MTNWADQKCRTGNGMLASMHGMLARAASASSFGSHAESHFTCVVVILNLRVLNISIGLHKDTCTAEKGVALRLVRSQSPVDACCAMLEADGSDELQQPLVTESSAHSNDNASQRRKRCGRC